MNTADILYLCCIGLFISGIILAICQYPLWSETTAYKYGRAKQEYEDFIKYYKRRDDDK